MSDTIPPLTEKDGESKNLVAENIEMLKQLFPEIVTDGKVDFETLEEVLGEFKEDSQERYSFTWNGKSKARKLAMSPSSGTLRPAPEDSVNWDSTKNLFIEGDNLEVLKLLQRSYHGKVKMIYIDPPYNTGNDFVYNDDFKDNLSNYLKLTGQKDGEGNKITSNPETSGRYHTDWLNMMYSRLKLARELLKEDGVIFISIDDNEVTNTRKLCDEIFGEEQFIAQLIWKSRQNKDNRNVTGASIDHEYVIVYGKKLRGDERKIDQYQNPDNDERGRWTSANMVGLLPEDQRPNCHYDLIDPETGINYGKPEMGWRYDKSTMNKLIEENKILWPSNKDGRPRRKKFLSELQDKYTGYSSIIAEDVYTRDGTEELKQLFGNKTVDFPKPTDLLIELIEQGVDEEDGIVLDFFAGSASTAHAVLKKNCMDSKSIRFIMVQLPEALKKSERKRAGFDNIAEIGKERIRRSIASLEENESSKEFDFGFRAFELSSSNLKTWDPSFDEVQLSIEDSIENIKPDRSEQDVLYEILLKYGLDLSLPIEEKEISGSKVFVAGSGALFICLAPNIDLDVVEGIAKLKEELEPELTRVVFRDSGFKDDVVKTNAVQILKQHGIDDVRSI